MLRTARSAANYRLQPMARPVGNASRDIECGLKTTQRWAQAPQVMERRRKECTAMLQAEIWDLVVLIRGQVLYPWHESLHFCSPCKIHAERETAGLPVKGRAMEGSVAQFDGKSPRDATRRERLSARRPDVIHLRRDVWSKCNAPGAELRLPGRPWQHRLCDRLSRSLRSGPRPPPFFREHPEVRGEQVMTRTGGSKQVRAAAISYDIRSACEHLHHPP